METHGPFCAGSEPSEQGGWRRDSELALLIDSARDYAICLLDPEGRVLIWNEGARRIYGWQAREVIGESFARFFTTEDIASDLPERQLRQAASAGSVTSRCWRLRKNGERFLCDLTLSRIDGEDGAVRGFGEVVRDVTTQEASRRAIELAAVQRRAILETVPDAMVVIDEQGTVESFSRAAERLFGYAADQVIGRNVSMLMPSPDRELHDHYIRRYLDTGERRIIGSNRRVMGRRQDGSTFPHELCIAEAIGGGRRMFTGFLRDLSAREAVEARLNELQTELLHMSRVSALGTMATALAHELNQPLMAIANYVQSGAAVLSSREETAQVTDIARQALEEAGREALRAGSIVQRLREFVSRGDLTRSPEMPEDLARQACALAEPLARPRAIHCEIEMSAEGPPVLADRVQLQQVLFNLIRNAIDALDEHGSIVLTITPGPSETRFTVADSGPGVAADQLATLFEPFASSKSDGMGLGLSICRTIVEAHGGRLWHETPLAGGAAFHFTIPNDPSGGA